MPKHKPLVSQHLEWVPRALLQKYQQLVRAHVKGRHGVYALYRGERLRYVGLASNLRTRLGNHLRDRHSESWDRFSVYLTIDAGHLKELETLVLRIAQPVDNRQAGQFAISKDLLPILQSQMREGHRRTEEEFFGPRRPGRAPERKRARVETKKGLAALAPYISKPTRLRARNKGRIFRARVRADGMITFGGEIFRSPSGAAKAALGRSQDGWHFWKIENRPDGWVEIDILRR